MTSILSMLIVISMLVSPFSELAVRGPRTAYAADTPLPPTPQQVTVPQVTLSSLPSLVVNIQVTPTTISLGSVVTMTITVLNQAPHSASNVLVRLPLPTGTTPYLPGSSYDLNLSLWQWSQASLPPDGTMTVSAAVTVSEVPTGNALVARASVIADGLQVPLTSVRGALLVPAADAPTAGTFTPGLPLVLRSSDGRVEVHVPADVSPSVLLIRLSSVPDPSLGEEAPPKLAAYKHGFPTFYLKATVVNAKAGNIDKFAKPVTIKTFYTLQELEALGMQESDLTLFRWDSQSTNKRWVPLSTEPFKSAGPSAPTAGTSSAETETEDTGGYQFSDGSSPSEAFIPSLKDWKIGLFTGSLTYQYPIDVPAGPGGIKPSLTLNYDSSSTDGHTGMRTEHQSGWAGKGWSLDTGYVALNKNSRKRSEERFYNLVFDGKSYDLQRGPAKAGVSDPKFHRPQDWEWHPTEESFIRIKVVETGGSGRYDNDEQGGQYASNKWQVWTKDGTLYEFADEAWQGWQNDETCTDPDYTYMEAYKWHLTSVTDTHGNKISYRYGRLGEPRQVDCGGHQMSGYLDYSVWPTSISWGANTVTGVFDRYRVKFLSDERTIDTSGELLVQLMGNGHRESRQLRAIVICSNQTATAGSLEECPSSSQSGPWQRVRQYNLRYYEGPQPEGQQTYLLSDACDKRDDGACPPVYGSMKLTLLGLRRVANDGVTVLPEITFSYGMTRGNGEYPAEGRWNRLWKADNGQGGVMEATYDVVGASMSPMNRHFKNNRRVTVRVLKDGMGTGPEHEYTWRYRYGTPAFNSLGRDLSEDPPNDPSTNAGPNSATLYFNKYWDPDHDNSGRHLVKERREFRGHDKVVELDPRGNETEHRFYQGDYKAPGAGDSCVPRESGSGPPVTGNAITGNTCFQEIRKREFLKGREWLTINYAGTVTQNVKLLEVERVFDIPLIYPITITNEISASEAMPGVWRSFSHESQTIERAFDGAASSLDKTTVYDYDEMAYGNLKEVRELQNSTVLRITSHSYVTKNQADANAPSGYVYIVDRKRSDNITDGQGRWLARTVYSYDNSTSGTTLGTRGDLFLVRKFHDLPVPPSTTLPTLIHSTDTKYTYDSYGNHKTITTYQGYGESRSDGTNWGAPGANTTAMTTTHNYENTFNAFSTSYVPPTANGVTLTQSAGYDLRMGAMTSITDANAVVTSAQYDLFGRMVKLIKDGDTSALPTMQAYYYDYARPFSYVVALREVSGSSTANRPIIKFYDGLGGEIQTKSESVDGTQHIVVDKVYDGLGQVTKQSQPRYVNNTAGSAAFWNYVQPDPSASVMRWTLTEYDGSSRSTKVTTPDSKFTTMQYNQGINTHTNTYMRQVVTVDAKGNKKAHLSDVFGRLSQVKEFDDPNVAPYASTSYEYSPLDLLEKVIDAKGKQITAKYDSLGRKTEINDLTMGRWTYTYNPAGTLKTQTDNKSPAQTITFLYDALDRLLTKNYSDGSHAEYRYDDTASGNKGKGRLTSTEKYGADFTRSALVQYRYDARGQKTGTTYTLPALNASVSQSYDAAGRVTSITYPVSFETVSYTYDAAWRQKSVCSSNDNGLCYASNAQYTALDQPDSYTLGNGLLQDFQYNSPMARLSTIRVGSLYTRSYTYDFVGNVSGINSIGPSLPAETQTFGYDGLDRLASWNLNVEGGTPRAETYWYDQVGNLTQKPGQVYTYNYSAPSGAGGPYAVRSSGYSYDANGNMLQGAGRTYTWNSDNQPASITSGGVTEEYGYDADGERTERIRGGTTVVTTSYVGGVYDQEEEREVGTNAYKKTKRYYYSLGGQVVAQREVVTQPTGSSPPCPGCPTPTPNPQPGESTVTKLSYLHSDHLGSVSIVTNSSGSISSRQEYDPWGKVRSGGVTETKLNFTGQRLDDTGLLYYHARYYDPSLARFVSPDSIVPGVESGKGGAAESVGAYQNHRLTVDFHETGFVSSLQDENKLTLEKGFWFQLKDEDRKDVNDPWGPENPQALNRYSYVLNNPLRYTDPTGHSSVADMFMSVMSFIISVCAANQTCGALLFAALNAAATARAFADNLAWEMNRGYGSNAYQEAKKSGGKHHGMYEQYKNKSEGELRSALQTFRGRVQEHAQKVADPANAKGLKRPWYTMSAQEQQGTLWSWTKEMYTYSEEADVILGIMLERGIKP